MTARHLAAGLLAAGSLLAVVGLLLVPLPGPGSLFLVPAAVLLVLGGSAHLLARSRDRERRAAASADVR